MDEFKSITDRLKADPTAKQDEQEVIRKYGELFHPKNIDHLTAEDFKSFLLFKNNCCHLTDGFADARKHGFAAE